MPTFIEGDRIKFHYNFGDYNNSLKTLTQTQTPNTPLVLSQINREYPIVFRQKLQDALASYLQCAHIEEALCYLSLELSFASSLKLTIYLQLDIKLKYKQFQHMQDFYCQGSQQQWPRIHATFNARVQNFFTHVYLLNCKSLALLIKPHFLTQACKHSLSKLYVKFCSLPFDDSCNIAFNACL